MTPGRVDNSTGEGCDGDTRAAVLAVGAARTQPAPHPPPHPERSAAGRSHSDGAAAGGRAGAARRLRGRRHPALVRRPCREPAGRGPGRQGRRGGRLLRAGHRPARPAHLDRDDQRRRRLPAARRAVADFAALGSRIDEASHRYINAVDAHDLDRDDLEASTASRARTELTAAKEELDRVKQELDRFADGLGPLLGKAETQLARLAPAVERARQALLGASNALDAVRASHLKADDLAARLAVLSPELTKLNQGAGRHGVPETLERAERVTREAEAIRVEAERLPDRAAEIDHRLVSLRTRAQALTTRSEQVDPILSELRRRFTAACWQDLQRVPDDAAAHVRQAESRLAEARSARAEQRWADATALLSTVRALLNSTDEAVSAAGDRLHRLNAVQKDPQQEIERTRFAIRDAQRLAMAGRNTPDPQHARPLDDAVSRLERAIATLDGRHPDYWHFLTETEAVRQAVARVVGRIREERGTGH